MPPIHDLINAPRKAGVEQLFPQFDKDELTRLVIQALRDLGYDRSAQRLKEESGLELDSPVINAFISSLRHGRFDEAEAAVASLHLVDDSEAVRRTIHFLIKRQKFLECLYVANGDNATALTLLRHELNELTSNTSIRSLTALLMNKNSEPLQLANGWLGDADASRENLLTEIARYINPNEMIPKHRLFKLVEQSIKYQESVTLYPFGEANKKVSLYEDMKSDQTHFPNTVIKTLDDHEDEVWYVAFSHDGKILATASADTSINLYDVTNNFSLIHTLRGHDKQVMYISFSPDDKQLLTCCIESNARVWNTETGEKEYEVSLNSDSRIWCGDWLPNGECFVLGSPDKEVGLFDAQSGKQLHKWQGSIINDMKVSEDYKLITVTYEQKIEVWDLKTKLKVKTLEVDERITSITISKHNPDHIVINVCPNEIQLWDWRKQVLVAKYIGHRQEKFILRSCFGCDEQIVCSGSEDGRVFLWNREYGALLGAFDAHKGNTNCVAWNNATGDMFATGGDDKMVKIWAPASKTEL